MSEGGTLIFSLLLLLLLSYLASVFRVSTPSLVLVLVSLCQVHAASLAEKLAERARERERAREARERVAAAVASKLRRKKTDEVAPGRAGPRGP